MALVVKDRVRETTTTTGTGTITLLGAAAGFQSFSVIGNANTTYYTIVDANTGAWEVGIGTYTSSGTTLSRDTILESSSGGSAINFAAGTKDVFVVYPAEKAVYQDATGVVTLASSVLTTTDINGGTVDGTTIGASSASTGAFTTLASNGATTFTAGTASTSTTTGTAVITGGLGVSGRINAANFDGIVGANTAAAGNFTTLGATGVATFSAGTVSLPAITTTGDTNTGIFFPAADTIAFAEGGAEAMRIDSSGNVGIGTTSPTYKLQIQSGASTILAGADSAATTLTDNTQKVMRFGVPHYTNAEEPVGALFVSNAASASSILIGGGTAQFNAATSLLFYTAANNTTVTGSERMRIDSSGNVGIGTSSPYSAAGVKTLQLTGADYSLFEQSVTTATAGYQNWRQIVRGSVGGHVYQMQLMNDANSAEQTIYEVSRTGNSVDYQRWYGGTNEAMRILSGGNVGIGTASPGTKLEVTGDITQTWAASMDRFVGSKFSTTYELGLHFIESSRETRIVSKAADSTGLISFYTGVTPTEKMRIEAGGNVGIGTIAPAARLSSNVSGAGSVTALNLTNDNGGFAAGTGTAINFGLANSTTLGVFGKLEVLNETATTGSNAYMAFSTRNADVLAEKMRISAAGNVGIGTSSPLAKLQVYPTVGAPASSGNLNTGVIFAEGAGGPSLNMGNFNSGGTYYAWIQSAFVNNAAVVQPLVLQQIGGNVGIGTASPGGKLEVVGGRTFLAAASELYACGVRYVSTGGAFYFGASDGTATPDGVFCQAGGSERMRITNSGNVLVGTSTSSDNTNGAKLEPSTTAGAPTVLKIMKTVSGGVNSILNYHSGTYVGGINFDNTSTSFPTSSDVRLKKDIVDAPSALLKVQDIRIVSHGWKHDDAVVEFGVIAQELVSVAPSAVMQGDDGEKVVTTWSVDYSKLVPILTKAIQEQQALIQDLTTRLTALEGN